jgi:hypothetical protein
MLRQAAEIVGEREVRLAVLPDDDRGNPLTDRGERSRSLVQSSVVVAVGIDESGSEDPAARIDDGLTGVRLQFPDIGDAVTAYPYRRRASRANRTVRHDGIDDERRTG